ncbi:hypothetical protein PR202_ga00629 [Eleusine coracana subsp. coracana]|uniref:Uncharacterized protein n=1 Tax=Eleusine coracana subsp. coracana TaxID=191504 RepID=A0AAV5BEB0_ELECO|nr:hypothetical protein PR202_ga00629 [Eleusine coracana subsp. coracana]
MEKGGLGQSEASHIEDHIGKGTGSRIDTANLGPCGPACGHGTRRRNGAARPPEMAGARPFMSQGTPSQREHDSGSGGDDGDLGCLPKSNDGEWRRQPSFGELATRLQATVTTTSSPGRFPELRATPALMKLSTGNCRTRSSA